MFVCVINVVLLNLWHLEPVDLLALTWWGSIHCKTRSSVNLKRGAFWMDGFQWVRCDFMSFKPIHREKINKIQEEKLIWYSILFVHFLFNMYKWNGKCLLEILKSGLLTLSFGACSYKDFSRLDFNRYVFKLNHVYSKIIIHIVMVFKVKRSCLICLWSIKHTRRGELNKVTILEV